MSEDQQFQYVLSKSVVRVSARVYNVHDAVLGTKDVEVDAAAELLTVADESAVRTVTIPGRAASATSSALVFRDDRRLASLEASSVGQGPQRLKAAVAVGGTVLGAALAAVSPVGGIGAVAALTAAVRSSGGIFKSDVGDAPESDRDAKPDPVITAYAEQHPAEAEALAKYRAALIALSKQHVAAADDADADRLTRAATALGLIRSQSRPLEDHLASWRLDQITRTIDRIIVEDLDVDDLPTEKELVKVLNTREVSDLSDRELRVNTPWIGCARRYGLAASVDDVHSADVAIGRSGGEIAVHYRPGRKVRLTMWKVERVVDAIGHDADGNEHTVRPHYVATPTDVRRVRIVGHTSADPTIGLDVDAWKSGKFSISFNDLGEPSQVGGSQASLVADGLATVGPSLKSAVETGSALSAALVPGSASAAMVERQLKLAKSRAELDPFINPREPSADDQALATLRDSVEIAELEARLQLARLSQLRTSATVIYDVG